MDRLLIRQWQPEDVTARWRAITASFDHLCPWWGDSLIELTTLAGQRAHIEQIARWPDNGGSFRYGVFDGDNTVLGGVDLHDRVGCRAIELGYWCHIAHTGRGVITRASAALTETALRLPGIDRVEIHCDAANTRSAAVARRLGFHLDRTERRDKAAPNDSGHMMFWIRHSSGLTSSACPASSPGPRS